MFFDPNQLYEEEKEEQQEIPKHAAPSCYGCKYMVASPTLDCCHPTSLRLAWDPVRNRTYRVPSIRLCREQNGLCKFYEPSPQRGAEYFMHKEIEETLRKAVSTEDRVDNIMQDLIDSGELDKFMRVLNRKYVKYLSEDLEDEEEEDLD